MQAGANALHPHERKDPTLTLLHEACFLEDEAKSLDIAQQVPSHTRSPTAQRSARSLPF